MNEMLNSSLTVASSYEKLGIVGVSFTLFLFMIRLQKKKFVFQKKTIIIIEIDI